MSVKDEVPGNIVSDGVYLLTAVKISVEEDELLTDE